MDAHILLEILEQTKDGKVFSKPHENIAKICQKLEVGDFSDGDLMLSREERMELAKFSISQGGEFETVINHLTWKDFEVFIAKILEEHSFKCIESLRRVGNERIEGMEIDVVGVRGATIVTIDAKMWGIRKGKTAALKKAAEKQMKRADELSRNLSILHRKMPQLESQEYTIYPLMVTWLIEDVFLHEGVPIVPVFKLNSFILNFESYQDLLKSCHGIFEKIERRED